MSDREKKLVLFFGLAAFLLVNFFGFSWLQGQKQKLGRQLTEAKGKISLAEATNASYDTVIEEMDWLGGKSPAPRSGQLVATELEQYASNQASSNQLTVKRRAIKPNEESGVHFHRAKVEFNVTGKEDGLYRWLSRLRMPDQFRAVTFMRLSPDAKDDTLIDATVEVEQWYVPLVDDGAAPAPSDETPAPVEEATPPVLETAPPGGEQPPGVEGSPLPPEALNPPGTE